MHVNELKSFKKKSKSMIKKKNLNEKKKVSCECSGSILKKTNKTNYCDKKQKNSLLITERFRMSLRSFNEKKKERKNDQWQSRCHILFRSTKNEGKLNKKKSKAFFMFFQQHYKRTNFSVFDDHIYARSPSSQPQFKTFKNECKPPLLLIKTKSRIKN